MKASGVEWIGEIPDDWGVYKIKHLCSLNGRIGWQGLTTNEYVDAGPYLITGTDFHNGNICWGTCVHITHERYDEAPQIQIQNGDLLITKDGTIGKVAIVHELIGAASLNSGVLLIRPIFAEKYVVRYCYYVFLSDIFWNWYESNEVGNSTIKHLYQEKFKEFGFPLPPLPTQYTIATFLDHKCSCIDDTIQKQRLIIDKLKEYRQAVITEAVTKGITPRVAMKESGVEWFGEIPEGWGIGKLKYFVTKIGSGKTPTGGSTVYTDSGITFLRSQNVHNTGLKLTDGVYISEEIDQEMISTRVYPNDVLLNITGASLGRSCIYPQNIGVANVNQHVCIIRTIQTTLLSSFLHYFLISSVGADEINLYQNGANREGLNFEQIGNLVLVYPSLPVQEQISSYLDAKCSAIDATIQKKEYLIDRLTEYKKSLIYEAVAGKMEITG